MKVNRADLLKLFPDQDDMSVTRVIAKAEQKRGRTKGTGYQRADAPLIEKMHTAIEKDSSLNATSAAKLFAHEAKGASFDAKVDRLARAYRAGRNGV